MSQENVEIAERAIAAVNERDIDGYLALCAPDVEQVSPLTPLEGINQGAEGIRRYFSGLDEGASTFHLDLERVEAVGDDRVLMFTRVTAVSKGGVPFDHRAANVYELAEGKIRRVQIFLDRAAALAAVGLRD
jgi:uncharacterized protein (TIGR02246 family)